MRFSLLIFGLLIPNLLVAQAPKKIIGTGVYTLARSSANARAEEVSFVPGKEVIRITIANRTYAVAVVKLLPLPLGGFFKFPQPLLLPE